jgi:preprotein translocase subunit SecA
MMAQESIDDVITEMRHGVVDDLVSSHVPHDAYPEAWNIAGLAEGVKAQLNLELPLADWAKEEGIADEELRERVEKAADEAYAAREQKNTPDLMRYVEKQVLLQTLDHLWREHLVVLDHLRQVIGWRGLGQRDPLNEYKSEAFELFDALITRLREVVTSQLMRVEVALEPPPNPELPPMFASHTDPATGEDEEALARINAAIAAGEFTPVTLAGDESAAPRDPNTPESWGRVGRNEPCPCGSGKKYKHCHGAVA